MNPKEGNSAVTPVGGSKLIYVPENSKEKMLEKAKALEPKLAKAIENEDTGLMQALCDSIKTYLILADREK